MNESITVFQSSIPLRLIQYLLIVQNKLPSITLLLAIQTLTTALHRQPSIIVHAHIPASQIGT